MEQEESQKNRHRPIFFFNNKLGQYLCQSINELYTFDMFACL